MTCLLCVMKILLAVTLPQCSICRWVLKEDHTFCFSIEPTHSLVSVRATVVDLHMYIFALRVTATQPLFLSTCVSSIWYSEGKELFFLC